MRKYLLITNLGGTAIGTGVNAPSGFARLVNRRLSELSGYKFKPSKDLVDATQNIDVFLHVSSLLQVSAIGISKICSDLRLLSSGPRAGFSEIKLPELQKGSTIMPGKNNPVTLETMNQISYKVAGNMHAASLAALGGQLELNAMFPTFIRSIIESFTILINGVSVLVGTIGRIKVDEKRCKTLFENSLTLSAFLIDRLGYDKVNELTKRAMVNDSSLLDEVKRDGLLNEAEIKKIFNKKNLTNSI